jgi:hypothetical protein
MLSENIEPRFKRLDPALKHARHALKNDMPDGNERRRSEPRLQKNATNDSPPPAPAAADSIEEIIEERRLAGLALIERMRGR